MDTIDAEITLLADAPELRHRARVQFHSFTFETMADVSLYRYHPVSPAGTELVRLKLAKPVVLLPGDRFVLRRPSPPQTIGGGRVLDVYPVAGTRKKKALMWFEKVKSSSPPEQLLLRVARRGVSGLALPGLAKEMGWTLDAAREGAQALVAEGALVMPGHDVFLAKDALIEAGERVMARMLGQPGPVNQTATAVKRLELRQHTGLCVEVFDAVLARLVREQKLALRGDAGAQLVTPHGAGTAPPEGDRKHANAVEEAYRSAGLQAPLFADVLRRLNLSEKDGRKLITVLLRDKTLVKIGAEDLFIHRSAAAELQVGIRALRGQTLDVSRFKQITGLSRKYAIPLLEHLDREMVTRKQGDSRLVL